MSRVIAEMSPPNAVKPTIPTTPSSTSCLHAAATPFWPNTRAGGARVSVESRSVSSSPVINRAFPPHPKPITETEMSLLPRSLYSMLSPDTVHEPEQRQTISPHIESAASILHAIMHVNFAEDA